MRFNITYIGGTDQSYTIASSGSSPSSYSLKLKIFNPSRAIVMVKKDGATYYDWKKYNNGTVLIRNLSGTTLDITVIDPHPVIVQIYMVFIAAAGALVALTVKIRKFLSKNRKILLVSMAAVVLILLLTASWWVPVLLQSLA